MFRHGWENLLNSNFRLELMAYEIVALHVIKLQTAK